MENRIAVLRLAAEVLCLLEGTAGMDLRRRKTVDELLSSGRFTIDEILPQQPAWPIVRPNANSRILKQLHQR